MRKVWLATTALILLAAVTTSANDWFDPFYPYRLRISLPGPADGSITLDLTPQEIIAALEPVCLDVIDLENFCFEKAVLVDPAGGQTVGRFELVVNGADLVRNGAFTEDMAGTWRGFRADEMQLEPVNDGADSFRALFVSKDKFTNSRLVQTCSLQKGAFYLLRCRRYLDTAMSVAHVALNNPAKRLFSTLPHSYQPSLQPMRQWRSRSTLYLADTENVELRIATAFIGRCGVADISLLPVRWRLRARLTQPTDTLDLYYVGRAGHKLTANPPDPAPADTGAPCAVSSVTAQRGDTNPGAFLVSGQYCQAWTINPECPLKAEQIKSTAPSQPAAEPCLLRVVRGGDATLIVAIDTKTPMLTLTDCSSDLFLDTRFERLCPIPVYNGPFPGGKHLETRFDAMMPINDPLIPPAPDGVHLLAVTFHADHDDPVGTFDGAIALTVQTPTPDREEVVIPVRVRVAAPVVYPMDHFGAIFGGQHFQIRYDRGSFTKTGTSILDFHGFPKNPNKIDSVARLTGADSPELPPEPVKELVSKYYHRMIDFNVQPQTVVYNARYTYTITEQGEGKAPLLSDWDFSDYDKALDELLIARRVPWLPVFHANGHIMSYLRLSNQLSYGFEERPDNPLWRQVSREEFFRLVGDYFDALARHLHERGLLGRAVYVVDESDPKTYPLILEYAQALQSRPYASQIKITHTSYKISTFISRLPNGRLVLDEALDIPMMDNDDHFNFFEPAYNDMWELPKDNWVYYVETDHFNLLNAGLSTIVTPLKLGHFGGNGWYCWGSFIWSMPYPVTDTVGNEFVSGPVVNPWLNPFYHHGPGVLSFFYPPDPRGPAPEISFNVVPSYRLALMRDGIQLRALLEVLAAGEDDAGNPLKVDQNQRRQAQEQLERLWADNPVQWYLSYAAYQRARQLAYTAVE